METLNLRVLAHGVSQAIISLDLTGLLFIPFIICIVSLLTVGENVVKLTRC